MSEAELLKLCGRDVDGDCDYRIHYLTVSELLKESQQRITELEQQLKTAKADGVREFSKSYASEVMRLPFTGDKKFLFESVADLIVEQAEEYANNLEGK